MINKNIKTILSSISLFIFSLIAFVILNKGILVKRFDKDVVFYLFFVSNSILFFIFIWFKSLFIISQRKEKSITKIWKLDLSFFVIMSLILFLAHSFYGDYVFLKEHIVIKILMLIAYSIGLVYSSTFLIIGIVLFVKEKKNKQKSLMENETINNN
ncbi:hypothetical protein ACJA25_02495 [Mycoplasmopsis hyopharyngis]|uniref:hypothetical protein n=1 Tax=Mycoplasmopsis hyopharyngis TaxID=29558 RepID=UPI0038738AE6